MKLLMAGLFALAAFAVQSPAEIVASIFTPSAGTPQRPSAAVAFIVNGAAHTVMFGTTTLSSGAAPGANTVYEIGSITKGLTGILLADMALEGDVSLHDTLEKFLPAPARFPEAIRGITLLQLATHMSGLPRLPANLMASVKDPANPYAHYGVAELDGVAFTWHNGGTGGYRSFIGFTRDGNAGIVVLTNGADQSPDPLAIRALQQLAAGRQAGASGPARAGEPFPLSPRPTPHDLPQEAAGRKGRAEDPRPHLRRMRGRTSAAQGVVQHPARAPGAAAESPGPLGAAARFTSGC